MYKISEYKLTEHPVTYATTTDPISRYKWKVVMNSPEGGLMKTWYLGANNCEINKVTFGMAEKGCLDANIKLANITFPVYYGNIVNIYYNNALRYAGFVSSKPDPSGDEIKITPYSKRLEEIFINTTYNTFTFREMLQDVITSNSSETGVYYNDALITYTDTATYSTYSPTNENIKKVIEDFYKNEDDSYWGVNEYGFIYIKTRSTAVVNHVLYSGVNQYFSDIKPTRDYSKVTCTRIILSQKSTSGSDNILIGTIPDGTTTYPYISLENEVGRKDDKKDAPDGLTATEAKDWAYAFLTAQQVPENIKISNVDITKADMRVGDYVTVYDDLQKQISQIISCDTTSGWIGSVSTSADSIEGEGSITFNSGNSVYYDFGEIQHYKNIEKLTFMIKCNGVGNLVNVGIADTPIRGYSQGNYSAGNYSYNSHTTYDRPLFTTSMDINVNVKTANSWTLVEIPTTRDFRYLSFTPNTTNSYTVNIDDIGLYGYFRNTYSGNVIKLDYNISKQNETLYNAEIGDYKIFVNDKLFKMEQKIKAIQNTLST